MIDLPPGWVVVKVRDVISLNPKNIALAASEAAFMPMSNLGTFFRDVPTFSVRPWGEIGKAYVHFAEGDVLLAKITPCFENGKAGIADGLPSGIGAGSSEFFVCRAEAEMLHPRWLLALFKTPQFLSDGAHNMSGSVGHKRVPKDFLLDTELPLPPFSEQQRIVAKLNTLLSRVDGCRERLERVGPLIKRFRQSVLASAMSGRLTADWHLLNGEAGWEDAELGDVAQIGTGSTPLRSHPGYFAVTGTPWVTSAATSSTVITSASEFVTVDAIKAHRLKLFPAGTLLVAMYGEGKTRGQVSELAIAATINQACAAVTVTGPRASKDFVKLALQANYLTMRAMAEGGNQPNLNLSKVRSVPLPLPSRAEQAEVVRRVGSLFGIADRLDARLDLLRKSADRLTPATLAKAFRGELVPQDSNDEPAEVLLARIRAERDAAPAAPRKRRASTASALNPAPAPSARPVGPS